MVGAAEEHQRRPAVDTAGQHPGHEHGVIVDVEPLHDLAFKPGQAVGQGGDPVPDGELRRLGRGPVSTLAPKWPLPVMNWCARPAISETITVGGFRLTDVKLLTVAPCTA